MKKQIVIKNEKFRLEYLYQLCKSRNIPYSIIDGTSESIIEMDCNDYNFDDIVAEYVIKFGKFDNLKNFFTIDENTPFELCAILGIVLSFNTVKEKIIITMRSKTDKLNVEGFLNFRLPELTDKWNDIGSLIKKIYDECETQKDIIAVCMHLIGTEGLKRNRIVVDDGLYFDADNKNILLMEVFSNYEKNLIFNMFMYRPHEVIIPHPYKYSYEFLNFIKSFCAKI